MKLNLLVLYAIEPAYDRTVAFYSALLDTEPVPEQHGAGPAHHSITGPDGLVVEIYPAEPGQRVQTSTRLGFACGAAELAVQRLMLQAHVMPSRTRDGRAWRTTDPLGNTVVLVEQPGWNELCGYAPDPGEDEKQRIEALFADPNSPTFITGVEYPPDSPQGRAIKYARDLAEWQVLRPFTRPGDSGSTAELREQALERMRKWVADREA